MNDNIPTGGYFEEMLSAVMQLDREARWEREDAEWEAGDRYQVRTEPVLRDPRPVRVVYGQVLGCSLADTHPGTVMPAAVHVPLTRKILTT